MSQQQSILRFFRPNEKKRPRDREPAPAESPAPVNRTPQPSGVQSLDDSDPIEDVDSPEFEAGDMSCRLKPATLAYRGSAYARLPHNPQNKFRVRDSDPPIYRQCWTVYEEELKKEIRTVEKLLITFSQLHAKKPLDLSGLASFLRDALSAEERQTFFRETLPAIQRAALRLPQVCGEELRLLLVQESGEVRVTREQAASLLACAFFCIVPAAPRLQRAGGGSHEFPAFSFAGLYRRSSEGAMACAPNTIGKLRCLLAYFRRALAGAPPRGFVSFHRRALARRALPVWEASDRPLGGCRVDVSTEGTIEDSAPGALHVDFANRFIGGGALSRGCVQEEIRFMINPECLVSLLLCAAMDDNEAILIAGAERVSNYSGYASSFEHVERPEAPPPLDEAGRVRSYIVAIDAEHYPRHAAWRQFREEHVRRELDKAFAGFLPWEALGPDANAQPIATGNWGGGAFNGDRELKFLIQAMAACQAGRDLEYFTFRDAALAERAHTIHRILAEEEATVGSLFNMLLRYSEYRRRLQAQGAGPQPMSPFQFIHRQLLGVESDRPPIFPEREGEREGGDTTEEEGDGSGTEAATPPRPAFPEGPPSPPTEEDEPAPEPPAETPDGVLEGGGFLVPGLLG
eukprot:tig00001234_g7739.t1